MHRFLGMLAPIIGLLAAPAIPAPPAEDPPGQPGGFRGFGIRSPTEYAPTDGAKLARMDVVAGRSSVAPGGEVLLGVRWKITPGWHLYWRNPGDSGTAPRISVKAPEGIQVGDIAWPRPVVFEDDWGDTTYGYEHEVILLLPLRIPLQAPEGPLTLEVDAEWLVCKEACLLGEGRVSIRMEIRADAGIGNRLDPAIEKSLPLVPRPLGELSGSTARLEPTTNPTKMVIEGPSAGAESIRFIPDVTPGVVAGYGHPVKATISDDKFRIEVPLEVEPNNSLGRPLEAAGLVLFGPGSDDPARSVRLAIDP